MCTPPGVTPREPPHAVCLARACFPRYGAAASSADVTAACEACVATRDPVGLSYSSAWCHLDGNCYTVGDTSNPCTENQCASQASLSQCICSGCDELTCAF